MTQSLIHIINCKIKELDFYIVCIDSEIIKNSCLSKSSFLHLVYQKNPPPH